MIREGNFSAFRHGPAFRDGRVAKILIDAIRPAGASGIHIGDILIISDERFSIGRRALRLDRAILAG